MRARSWCQAQGDGGHGVLDGVRGSPRGFRRGTGIPVGPVPTPSVSSGKSWEKALLRKAVVSDRLQRLLQPKLLKYVRPGAGGAGDVAARRAGPPSALRPLLPELHPEGGQGPGSGVEEPAGLAVVQPVWALWSGPPFPLCRERGPAPRLRPGVSRVGQAWS